MKPDSNTSNQEFKILVVDDEENVLQSIRKVVESKIPQATVDSNSDPVLGLEMVKTNKYDLLIIDLMMPKCDGNEFIQKVKESKLKLKIIMITGYATNRARAQAFRTGVDGYIEKPFTRKELVSTILSFFDN
ncbi:MAG: response regulator [Fibrobacteria bacterium]|nr:response regulator [Fibrobacteria bacterium]